MADGGETLHLPAGKCCLYQFPLVSPAARDADDEPLTGAALRILDRALLCLATSEPGFSERSDGCGALPCHALLLPLAPAALDPVALSEGIKARGELHS